LREDHDEQRAHERLERGRSGPWRTSVGRLQIPPPAAREGGRDHTRLEEPFRVAAGERHELVVHYQPIVSLVTDRIVGFEALTRGTTPRGA
jgi:hypothetical protein